MQSLRFSIGLIPFFIALAMSTVLAAADKASDFTLDNGLRVRLVPLEGEKEVFVILGVRAGFFEEPAGVPHLAHITEHLIVFGSPAGSDEEKAADRWYREGRSNGETLPGWMYFDLHVPQSELETALKVQATRLSHPEFTDETLAREVPRAVGELEQLETSEKFSTGKFATIAFVQGALHGQANVPIKAKSKEITVEAVRRFHAATFRPDRAVLCVVGDFDAVEIRKMIERAFATTPKPPSPIERPARSKGEAVTSRWDARTRHLILAWPTPSVDSPEHAALSVANDGLSRNLHADAEIARLAKPPTVANDVPGWFFVNVQAKPEADLDILQSKLLAHVRQLSTPEGFPEPQVAKARQDLLRTLRPAGSRSLLSFLGGSSLMMRTNQELQRMGRAIVWGDLDGYAKRVESLDGDEVRAAVGRRLDPEKAVVVRVIPSQ